MALCKKTVHCKMTTLKEYKDKIRFLSKGQIVEKRREIFNIINGDAFFLLKAWPQDMIKIFWSKPQTDIQTFKLMLFCLGDGCAPSLITEWILLSQMWMPEKAEKQAKQMDSILANMDRKMKTWFYYDIDYGKWLYLNGLPRFPATRC